MNTLFDKLPSFASLTEVEKWEEARRNAPPTVRMATAEDLIDPYAGKREHQRINDHIKSEKERLARIEQERLDALDRVRDVMAYSERLSLEICERIGAGEFRINICSDAHLPTMRRCNQWLRENLDFAALYKQSIEERLNIFEDQLVTIPDDATHDYKIVVKNGKERRVFDPEAIARSKLRVEARRWHLKAYRPQKWGEVSTLNVKNEGEAFDPASMTAEELEKTIADIERKARVSKAA
jgi:hypothetical protein